MQLFTQDQLLHGYVLFIKITGHLKKYFSN